MGNSPRVLPSGKPGAVQYLSEHRHLAKLTTFWFGQLANNTHDRENGITIDPVEFAGAFAAGFGGKDEADLWYVLLRAWEAQYLPALTDRIAIAYNWAFDQVDARAGRISSQRSHVGRISSQRSHVGRIVHALGFEVSLTLTSSSRPSSWPSHMHSRWPMTKPSQCSRGFAWHRPDRSIHGAAPP
jgi:hypothetical protein